MVVPHLVTALAGPISELEQRMIESVPAIERWFRLEWMEHTPAFYASVDLRNAGYKLAPVDTDLFPHTFAHLAGESLGQAVQAAMVAIEKVCPEEGNLLLLPQRGPLTARAIGNVERLVAIFDQAGLNVRLGALDATADTQASFRAPRGGPPLRMQPIQRQGRRLGVDGFDACTVLLNDDLSGGMPAALQGLAGQHMLPSLRASWGVRTKGRHFTAYEELAKRFARLLGMDPWLLTPAFEVVGDLDLQAPGEVERLQAHVDSVLARTRRKLKEYGIAERAYVVIKSQDDVGGGRAIHPVHAARDVQTIAAARDAIGIGKDGLAVRDVIVQEGIPTSETIDGQCAEPVVLTIDRYVVGGSYRIHPQRTREDVLNGPGSRYEPMLPVLPIERDGPVEPNRFYTYGAVARLAMLASAYELEAAEPPEPDAA